MFMTCERYPDPRVRVIDSKFSKYVVKHAGIERITTGYRWCEGPVWFGDWQCLLWSDIPNDRIMGYYEPDNTVFTFRKPSHFSNGNTRNQNGLLITCEHSRRRVTRTEHNGSVTVVADSFDGKRLNSPNDVVTASDGAVWFSDPTFGLKSFYEGGVGAKQELKPAVYRVDPTTGIIEAQIVDMIMPNGLAFSPDESILYVVDSGTDPLQIVQYPICNRKVCGPKKVLISASNDSGRPDGFRVDVDGNLWCGWGEGEGRDGVRVFDNTGKLIGAIDLPERCANLCFGGKGGNRLFMASSSSVYSLYVDVKGAV